MRKKVKELIDKMCQNEYRFLSERGVKTEEKKKMRARIGYPHNFVISIEGSY